ncbi:interferon-inducible GTPase-domain-containing protein [Melanogaster broomeanus]|nr:interferon-inducible GTPase-domain-containing protein [Melanogaster broomeanus]
MGAAMSAVLTPLGTVASTVFPPLGVVAVIIATTAATVVNLIHSLHTSHIRENPTLREISSHAQEAADAARADAEAAREEAAAARAEAEEAACADAQRVLREMLEREEAERAALAQNHAEAEEAGRAARADMERARQVLAESKRAEEDAKQRVEQAQRAAEEEKRKAMQAQAAAEQAAIEANERACAAKKAQQEAEERLQKGIQPVIMPSRKELEAAKERWLEAAKERVQYKEGLFHFAVAGVAGGGKSSLINAFRGLRNRDIALGAAPTGVTETTLAVSRLPDPNKANPFVWYDIPGAGTLRITDWQYFHAQGLYVFDCIIVVYDSRFTMTDIAILMNCKRFNIPTYIVRSKADAHIRSVMREMGYDSEDEDAPRTLRKTLYKTAREDYITETRTNVKRNLEEANLPDQRVYIVSNEVLFTIVKSQTLPNKIIDELELMRDLLSEAHSRRCVPPLPLA